ncbi:MAG: undecaprenyl-diphosphate phosphatase [Acidobacteriota bacterium]
MDIVRAAILALVQGLTEFLPISSSAHLILVPVVFGWADQGLVFDILVNSATLSAVVVYFRHDLRQAIAEAVDGGFWRRSTGGLGLAPALGLGTLPALVFGLAAAGWIGTAARDPTLIAVTSIVFGLLLAWADRVGDGERTLDAISWRDAVWVGLAQAVALVPGTSRSGITLTAALLLGMRRDEALRFSFLLAIPIGLAALVYDLRKLLLDGPGDGGWLPLAVAFAVAAVSAYAVIGWLLDWIRRQSLTIFVVYRVALGIVILWLTFG